MNVYWANYKLQVDYNPWICYIKFQVKLYKTLWIEFVEKEKENYRSQVALCLQTCI